MLIDTQSAIILTWEEYDRPSNPNIKTYSTLVTKVRESLWEPTPPIILIPMPPPYTGKYQYFLYNGHTRLHVSREYHVPLLGLVTSSDLDIPKEQLIEHGMFTLEQVLRGVICRKIQPHPTIDSFEYWKHDLTFLMQAFQQWEEQRSLFVD